MVQTTSAWEPQERLAPIVLFVYNRIGHTKRTIEALKNNLLAQESELYVYSDGPKEDSKMQVQEVREYLRTISGFKNVAIIEREQNWGLARNIIDGVTSIVNQYGKVIVMEDDLVSSRFFLTFMNDALKCYQSTKRVMQVSGYNRPIDVEGLEETYFFRLVSSWGWGTWKDRWEYFERDIEKTINSFSDKDIFEFNIEGTSETWNDVILNKQGKIFTWAVFFYVAVFKQRGLVLYPRISYINNIGLDGSGVHCGKTNNYAVNLADTREIYFENNIEESVLGLERNKRFYRKIGKKSLLRKTKEIIKKVLEFVGLLDIAQEVYKKTWRLLKTKNEM